MNKPHEVSVWRCELHPVTLSLIRDYLLVTNQ